MQAVLVHKIRFHKNVFYSSTVQNLQKVKKGSGSNFRTGHRQNIFRCLEGSGERLNVERATVEHFKDNNGSESL